jgi:hypothetical protein
MRTIHSGALKVSLCSLLLASVLSPGVANATNYTVETFSVNLANDGLCSLREAVQASTTMLSVNGSDDCPAGTGTDTIFLPAGTYVSTVKLTVSKNLTIQALGSVTIKTATDFTQSELFAVTSGGQLYLLDLTLERGSGSTQTRGVYASNAHLTLERVIVTGFTLSGIYATATTQATGLSVLQSVIKNNSTQFDGGGIYSGPNISLGVENSTISNNTAAGKGGGIHHRGWGNSNLNRSTISNNSAARGGGFYNNATGSGGNYVNTVRLTVAGNSASISGGGIVEDTTTNNTFGLSSNIIADNTAPTNPNFEGDGHASGCIFGPLGTGAVITHGDVVNAVGVTPAQLKLGPLLDMGGWYGSTPVRPLLKGSAAIDYTSQTFSADQRNIQAQDGNNDGSVRMDVGAHEANLIWENEIGGYVDYSDVPEIDATTGYSGFGGLVLHSDATNDYITVPMYFAESGTYSVEIRAKRTSDGGRFRLGTSTTTSGFTEFGTTVDLYSSSTNFTTVSLGTRSFNAGTYYFRYRVTGKALSSSGYQLYPDYIKVIKN